MTVTPLSPYLRKPALRSLTTLACVCLVTNACSSVPKLKDDAHSAAFVDDGTDYYSSELDGDLTFKRLENQWQEDAEGNRIYHVNRVVTPRGDTLFYVGDYDERERQNAALEHDARNSFDRISRFHYASPNRTPTQTRVIDSFSDDANQLPDPNSGMSSSDSTDTPAPTPVQPPRAQPLDLDNRSAPSPRSVQPERARTRASQPRSQKRSDRKANRRGATRVSERD